MTTTSNTAFTQNPFSAKRLIPGVRPYVPPDLDEDASTVATKRLIQLGFGQITGPHGCGKTSLAREIYQQLHSSEIVTTRFVVVRNRHQVENVVSSLSQYQTQTQTEKSSEPSSELVVIDGVERLSLLHRVALLRFARRSCPRTRVLITSHRQQAGWPLIAELKPTQTHFCQIASQLLESDSEIPDMLFKQAYKNACGNYRQALMELYDQFGNSATT